MKRYVFLAAFICLALSFLSKSLNITAFILLSLLFAFLFVFFLLSKKRVNGLVICMAIVTLFSLLTVKTIAKLNKINNLNGKTFYLSTVVCESDDERNKDYKSCTVKVLNSKNNIVKRGDKLVLRYTSAESFELGTRLDGDFSISSFDLSNEQFSFVADGKIAYASSDNLRKSKSKVFIYEFAEKVQSFIKDTLLRKTDNSGLLLGMVYGEKGFISNKLSAAVRACGVSHVLVVSGMHFAVICGGFLKLCNLITKKQKIKDVLQIIFMFFFCCVCGFSPSVLRVSVVYIMLILYKNTKRVYNSFVAWCNALILVLFTAPAAFHSLSFQLSFSAVLGILVLYPHFRKALQKRFPKKKVIRYVLNIAAVSLSALIATFPSCVYYFGYVSVVAVIVNVLIGAATSIMLVCAVIGVAVSAINLNFVSSVLFFIADGLADYFCKTVYFFSKLPFCCMKFNNTGLLTIVVLLFYFAVYLLYTCKKRPDLIKLYKSKLKEGFYAVCKRSCSRSRR